MNFGKVQGQGRAARLLCGLLAAERIPSLPVYLDSPMAIEATVIYARHPEEHDTPLRAVEISAGMSDAAARLTPMKQSLSAREARRMALAAQGFGRRSPVVAGTRQLNAMLGRMHTLQIDSVNVYARSHYMPLFSRLGPYDTALLDRLLFARRSPYVEFWAHVAAFIPASDWQLFRFRMDDHRARFTAPGTWFAENLTVLPFQGVSPVPFLIRNDIGNFPTKDLYFGSDNNFFHPYYPELWFRK